MWVEQDKVICGSESLRGAGVQTKVCFTDENHTDTVGCCGGLVIEYIGQ